MCFTAQMVNIAQSIKCRVRAGRGQLSSLILFLHEESGSADEAVACFPDGLSGVAGAPWNLLLQLCLRCGRGTRGFPCRYGALCVNSPANERQYRTATRHCALDVCCAKSRLFCGRSSWQWIIWEPGWNI